MKTIFMPEEAMKKWLAALRSGEYKQGARLLQNIDGEYCCLGVLQHCLDGKTEHNALGQSAGLPSLDWMAAHEISFNPKRNPRLGLCNPDGEKYCAAAANDSGRFTFSQIADALEEAYGGPMENMTKEAP